MKLGKVAIIGALTLGGFTAVEMIKPTTQAAAAYSDPFNDEWGLKSWQHVHHNANYSPDITRVGDLKQGEEFRMSFGLEPGESAVMKIFRIHDLGDAETSLQRYITIQDSGVWTGIAEFKTPITAVYTPDTYVAVMKLTLKNGETTFLHGQPFKITQ
ncbi:DUF5065 family protein [Bacillus gaemokensis]|uniref:Uncharacterized protein n=1 Tax=Bacillus gaemokensis TaxID=574375 RepID=A0A073KDQ1_9BACI|nr:DUF5065 family protein [Bacillus gaemokensis]KEK24720.1 hypothetical protein BAGA_23955 [Bacillus gaemokensis]KYG34541.1 hypothetical protein AZF08_09085 [Bacillus gaemokensis]